MICSSSSFLKPQHPREPECLSLTEPLRALSSAHQRLLELAHVARRPTSRAQEIDLTNLDDPPREPRLQVEAQWWSRC